MAKETTKVYVNIELKDESRYEFPVDSVELDNICLSVYNKQGGLNFDYNDIKSIKVCVYHDNEKLVISGAIGMTIEEYCEKLRQAARNDKSE